MQPFFENISKKNQNFKKIKIEVFVSWSVFKLEKKTKKIREDEEKLCMKTFKKTFYHVFKILWNF